jgi:hypothetical protein
VRACNPIGCTGYSGNASVTVVYPPGAAPGLNAPSRSGPGSIGIGWSGVGGADRYTLLESANGAGWVTLLDANATSYATPWRGPGNYAYRVAACNGAGCSGWSGTASVSVIAPPSLEPVISAPGLVNVTDYAFSWSTPANTEYFVLQESANGGGWTTLLADARTSVGVSRGNGSYGYRVQACNFVGCGPWSGIATVTVSLPPPDAHYNHGQLALHDDGSLPHLVRCRLDPGGDCHRIPVGNQYRWQTPVHRAEDLRERSRQCVLRVTDPGAGLQRGRVFRVVAVVHPRARRVRD